MDRLDLAMNWCILALVRMVTDLDYSVIVFDTAPTGHTLRFLNFPNVLEKACARLFSLSGRFGPMVSQVGSRIETSWRRQRRCCNAISHIFFYLLLDGQPPGPASLF
jgi:anion-transporting  ArsA/GET3 family ATPase